MEIALGKTVWESWFCKHPIAIWSALNMSKCGKIPEEWDHTLVYPLLARIYSYFIIYSIHSWDGYGLGQNVKHVLISWKCKHSQILHIWECQGFSNLMIIAHFTATIAINGSDGILQALITFVFLSQNVTHILVLLCYPYNDIWKCRKICWQFCRWHVLNELHIHAMFSSM